MEHVCVRVLDGLDKNLIAQLRADSPLWIKCQTTNDIDPLLRSTHHFFIISNLNTLIFIKYYESYTFLVDLTDLR